MLEGKARSRYEGKTGKRCLLRRRLWDPNQLWDLVSWPRLETEGINSNNLCCAVVFPPTEAECTEHLPSQAAHERQHCVGGGMGCDEGIGSLRMAVSYFCARDKL